MEENVVLYEGQRVHYVPRHGGKIQNGIIKSFRDKDPWNKQFKNAFVVYNCAGDWGNYKEYTGALTSVSTLKPGWHKVLNLKNLIKEKDESRETNQ